MKYKIRKSHIIIFLFILIVVLPTESKAQNAKETKINAMIKQMTLEEKVGQMAQVSCICKYR